MFPSNLRLRMGNRIYYPDLGLVCHPVDLEALYLEGAQEKRTAYSYPFLLFRSLSPNEMTPTGGPFRGPHPGLRQGGVVSTLPGLEEVYRF